jgi:hypothetical protein
MLRLSTILAKKEIDLDEGYSHLHPFPPQTKKSHKIPPQKKGKKKKKRKEQACERMIGR